MEREEERKDREGGGKVEGKRCRREVGERRGKGKERMGVLEGRWTWVREGMDMGRNCRNG